MGTALYVSERKLPSGRCRNRLRPADFNGDGKLDLAVANLQTGVNTVSLILGNGDGTFQPDQEFATADGPYRLAIADLNRDGKLDVAVAAPSNLGSFASILLGNGDGTLQPHVDYATGENTDWVMPINVNGDFYPDLAVVYTDCMFGVCSGPGTGAVSILVATGRGTFGPRQDFATDLDPAEVTLADLDRDGILDAVTANTNSSTVSVLLGKGDGSFQPHVEFPSGASPEGLAVADFNGDGVPDLAVADSSGNTVSILLGKGDGSFQGHADLPTGQFPVSIVAGDFNNDGKVDLAVGNGGPNVVSILMGNGDGGFKAFQTFAVAGPATSLAVARFQPRWEAGYCFEHEFDWRFAFVWKWRWQLSAARRGLHRRHELGGYCGGFQSRRACGHCSGCLQCEWIWLHHGAAGEWGRYVPGASGQLSGIVGSVVDYGGGLRWRRECRHRYRELRNGRSVSWQRRWELFAFSEFRDGRWFDFGCRGRLEWRWRTGFRHREYEFDSGERDIGLSE